MSVSEEDQQPMGSSDLDEREQIIRQLQDAVDFSEVILEAIPDTLFEVDSEGRYHKVWAKNLELLAIHERALLGRTVSDILQPEAAEAAMDAIMEADTKGRCMGRIIPIVQQNGETGWFEHSIIKRSGSEPSSPRFIVLSRDVTERRKVEQVVEEAKNHLLSVLRTIPDMVWLKDMHGRYLLCNHAFEGLTGQKEEKILGCTDYDLFAKDLADFFRVNDQAAFEAEKIVISEEWVVHTITNENMLFEMRKVPVFDFEGQVVGTLGVGRDITELNASREKIHRMAYYDTLTSLANRDFFNNALKHAVVDMGKHDHMIGVMLIDLDRFKSVNDSLGHPVGDELLYQAAKRLRECVREGDTVARFGGDEFAILLPYASCDNDFIEIAETILAQFNKRFVLGDRELFISCSIGIAICPRDSMNADDLIKYADTAMYSAKHAGRNTYCFYSSELTAFANECLLLESDLRHAVEREELKLYYQPKVLLESGDMIGSEALLRWFHPEKGMIPPDQFIPIAEESSLIKEIGQWVMREACRTAVEFNTEGSPLHKVAVNLSVKEFLWPGLAERVSLILEETSCLAQWIEIEITESLLLDVNNDTIKTFSMLRDMGISIAVDDFGTGYSALAYLTRFPINTLKLDRSFISSPDSRSKELVKAVLMMARGLGQTAVAEGVETVDQADFLIAHGCNVAQGYLYSHPLPKEELSRFKGTRLKPA